MGVRACVRACVKTYLLVGGWLSASERASAHARARMLVYVSVCAGMLFVALCEFACLRVPAARVFERV